MTQPAFNNLYSQMGLTGGESYSSMAHVIIEKLEAIEGELKSLNKNLVNLLEKNGSKA